VAFRCVAGLCLPFVAVLVGLYGLHSAWSCILLYHLGILVFLLAARARGEVLRRFLTGGSLRLAILYSIPCLLAGPFLYVYWKSITPEIGRLPVWLARHGLSGRGWLFFVAYYASVHPVLEELHWRGLLARDRGGSVAQDLAFAGYHVPVLAPLAKPGWVLLAFVALTAAAFCWRRAVSARSGLLVPVLSHAAADLSVMLAVHALL